MPDSAIAYPIPVALNDPSSALPRVPKVWVLDTSGQVVSNASPAPTFTKPAAELGPLGTQVLRYVRTDSDTTKFGYGATLGKPSDFPLPVGKQYRVRGHVKASAVGTVRLQYTNVGDGSSNVASQVSFERAISAGEVGTWVAVDFTQDVAVSPTTQAWRVNFRGATSSVHIAPITLDVALIVTTAPA